jgi:hypothetical protein
MAGGGAALSISAASIQLVDSIFHANVALGSNATGGAARLTATFVPDLQQQQQQQDPAPQVLVQNCTFEGNRADMAAGALALLGHGSAYIIGGIFASNIAGPRLNSEAWQVRNRPS